MAASKVEIWVEDYENVTEKLAEVLGFNPLMAAQAVAQSEPDLSWTPLEASEPDPEFIARLSALIGPGMTAALLKGTQSQEHEVICFVKVVPEQFFFDADPERAATKLADESRETVYNIILERQQAQNGDDDEDDDGDTDYIET